MPKILSVATETPPYRFKQDEAKQFAGEIFKKSNLDLERLLPIFDNSGIGTRYFSTPVEWFYKPHSMEEKNRIYIESATDLSHKSSMKALDKAKTNADEIDYIIYINSTGLATPSIDARLINIMNMKPNIHRSPLWGLGCAGGAAGISHAYHYLLGHPKEKVLLVATELCGLTFIPEDMSKSNLVATALFSEGSAAVVLGGDEVDADGLEIVSARSRFYPDSLDVMGWNIVSEGMQVVFARRIPEIVKNHAYEDLSSFLSENEMTFEDISHYVFHPGGVKVIEAYEKSLNMSNGDLRLSRDILWEYGNMSSVTVLFVLERFLKELDENQKNRFALMSALGPGFCSESVLLKI